MTGARVESQTDDTAVLVRGKQPDHKLHLILTILTCSLWGLVWLALALVQREHRTMLVVDPFGAVLRNNAQGALPVGTWVSAGLAVLVGLIVLGVIASTAEDDQAAPATQSRPFVQDQPPAPPEAPSPDATASSAAPAPAAPSGPDPGPSTTFPKQDGDWRLDTLQVATDGLGHFDGIGLITYTGDNPRGGGNLFTVTIFANGQIVGTLNCSLNDVPPGAQRTCDMYSFDDFVEGPFTFSFQNDL